MRDNDGVITSVTATDDDEAPFDGEGGIELALLAGLWIIGAIRAT